MCDKKLVRQKLKEVRANIADRQYKDNAICKNLLKFLIHLGDCPLSVLKKTIFIYQSIGTEVSTKDIIDKLKDKHTLVYPVVDSEFNMTTTDDSLTPDIAIVPLLGFNEQMHRIGYGKACYDKYFSKHPKMIKIGLAYSEQRCEFVQDEYDVALDYVITQ